jgi:hypothetical protein
MKIYLHDFFILGFSISTLETIGFDLFFTFLPFFDGYTTIGFYFYKGLSVC